MTDNVKVNPSLNNNAVNVATDEIDSVHFPVYKHAFGKDGTATLVSSNDPLPINLSGEQGNDLITSTYLLNNILTELKILNAYNARGYGEMLTEDDLL